MKTRLVVLASGNGTNLQAIIDACSNGTIDGRVVAVISDRADAGALERARSGSIPAIVLVRNQDETRPRYDARLAGEVIAYQPAWVVLAGWMRILTMEFLAHFPERVINLHPALPGEFAGTKAIERALAAGVDRTGVMVHLVPDEGVDDGPALATEVVPIAPTDTLDTLTERVHAAEHRVLVSTLARLCAQEINA